uniref:Protein Hook homolog 3 n=1 Tax=Haliotis discus discus TaxID=91233 RepID=A0A7I6IQ25_HALDI|nr:protein Hook-like protein 3-like [Haliotis discus discus]
MDRDKLCTSLITWLKTFNIDVPCSTADELSNGIAMAQVLHQIAPDYFSDSWMSKMKRDDTLNWRLKVSNLKKILKGILEYNLEVLGIQIQGFQMPDINAIGEHNNASELGRLLQLILGCAVNCEEKHEYIQRIMAMEESVQQMIMNAIQELMTKEIASAADSESEMAEQLKKTVEELNSALEAKEELLQRCHELDMQVASLSEEKSMFSVENERLLERLHQAESMDDPSTPAGKRYHHLSSQIEKLQEEVYKLETGKDDYRIKFEVASKELAEQKEKNAELSALADEARSLKDELDILRHTSEQVAKYESTIESYKKKLEDMSDLRGQIKMLEEKNTKYMQEHLELQEDARKASSLKQQLEMYKIQTHELQSKLADEIKRADKAEFEFKRVQEKMVTLQSERDRIATERDSLKEMNEELKCTTQFQVPDIVAGNNELPDLASTPHRMEMLSIPPEIKEKLLRLEHENRMLTMGSAGTQDEQTQLIQTMLDDANARKNELETEVRIGNQRILELEAQLEDLQDNKLSSVSNTEVIQLHKKINELEQKVDSQTTELGQRNRELAQLQGQVSAGADRVLSLQEQLNKKDDDMKTMEERYTRYLERAKQVVSEMSSMQKMDGDAPELQLLRSQLIEKERQISQMEKESEKTRNIRDQEQKLMVSAWYNLGMQIQRKEAEERLVNSSLGQSFLARQRQTRTRQGQPQVTNRPNSTSVSLGTSNNIPSS